MRILIPVFLIGLTACSPQVPNSAAQGVGFGDPTDYASERARRDAMLETGLQVGPVISTERTGAGTVQTNEVLTEVLPQSGGASPIRREGISDEQSFDAVSARETIESDAARLAQQRAEYEVVAPVAIPDRPEQTGPNIVAYALSTTNSVGQPLYKRSPVNAQARFERACAAFTSADQAQAAFLEQGGPENDRKGMDPDGDGFACQWDPAPFRTAKRG